MSAVAEPAPLPCLHRPPPEVEVPTPGVVAGTCQVCGIEVGGYVCEACGQVVPMINLAGRMSGGCRGCGAA